MKKFTKEKISITLSLVVIILVVPLYFVFGPLFMVPIYNFFSDNNSDSSMSPDQLSNLVPPTPLLIFGDTQENFQSIDLEKYESDVAFGNRTFTQHLGGLDADVSEWSYYEDDVLSLRYPEAWDIHKEPFLKKNPHAKNATKGKLPTDLIYFDVSSDPYSHLLMNIYDDSIDNLVNKLSWEHFAGLDVYRREETLGDLDVYYFVAKEKDKFYKHFFIGNENTTLRISADLSEIEFPGYVKGVLSSIKLK